MQRALQDGFKFVSSMPIEQEKIDLGYNDDNEKYDFIIKAYENKESYDYAKRLAIDSDVVIQGGSTNEFIKDRLTLTDKLTFRYIERLFKRGHRDYLNPAVVAKYYDLHTRSKNSNFYLLCAGGYVAADCKRLRAYKDKMYKWGYFPQTQNLDINKVISEKSTTPVKIMWAGRLIDWKHCEQAIETARLLDKDGYDFILNIVGIGTMQEELINKAKDYGIYGEKVFFLGSMSPDEVREEMKKSSIYLITSDFNEGWGAVLNESMNSGCAVVVSHAVGAVPFLVKDGENALIYKNGKTKDLYLKTKKLLDDANLRKTISKNAYYTIINQWNAENATKRLLETIEQLQEGKCATDYLHGPCSRAEIIENNWYKQ